MKLVLFDIDGTLLMTGGAGRIAIERVFEERYGVPNSWGGLVPDGKTDPLILDEIAERVLRRALTREEQNEICEQYHFHFRSEIEKMVNFRVLPGVHELVSSLSVREDLILGVATGNYEEAAWLKLEKGNLKNHFSFGGFGSDSHDQTALTGRAIERAEKRLGRALPRDKVFVIGDTIYDIRAGKNLGAKTIAVATGSTPKETLSDMKPDILLESLLNPEPFLSLLGLTPSKVS